MTRRRRIYDLRPVRRPEAEEQAAVAHRPEPVPDAEEERDPLTTLQQNAGNRAMQRQIESGGAPPAGAPIPSSLLQAKLAVTPEDDALEHEADQTAQHVLSTDEPAPAMTAQAEDVVERRSSSGAAAEVSPELEQEIDGLRGGGAPLSEADRAFFEPRFGRDFGDVRIHSDARAAKLTREVDARAFTVGGDIAFGPGEYESGSGAGRELLAHELAHVVQQNAAPAAVQRQPATKSKPKKKPKEQTFDFGDDEGLQITIDTHTLPKTAEHSGTTEVKSLIEQQSKNLAATQNALRTGIDDFADFMKFASSKEAKADYAGVAAKFALEQILDMVFEHLGEEGADAILPGAGTVWKLTKGLIDKLQEEGERAAKAAGEVAARDFVVKFRDSITDSFNDAITKDLPKLAELAVTEFQDLGGESTGHEKGSDLVTGDAATFLNNLKSTVGSYRVPTSAECLRIFAEEWVKQSEGDLMSRGGGDMYTDGRILISWHIDREVEDGVESWSPDEYPKKAELAAPKSDKVADAFMRVFKEGEKSGAKDINDIDILKVLTIDVEDEVSGFNDHYDVHIHWRALEEAYVEHVVPSPVRDPEVLAKAPGIGQEVLQLFQLVYKDHFGITELEGVEEGRKIASGKSR